MRRSWPLRQAIRGGLRPARSGEAHRPSQLRFRVKSVSRSRTERGRPNCPAGGKSRGSSRAEARAPFLPCRPAKVAARRAQVNAGGRMPPLNRSGAASSAPFIEDDLRLPNVKERPGALAAASPRSPRGEPQRRELAPREEARCRREDSSPKRYEVAGVGKGDIRTFAFDAFGVVAP